MGARMRKCFFVAGEASGDSHAADVIRELLRMDPDLEVHAYGGAKMRDAGAKIHYPLPDLGSVGLDWVWKVFEFRRIGLRILDLCKSQGIDTLVLVDFPGFNLRVATAAKSAGLQVIYYITPQVWAWRAGRVKRMRRDLDLALVILPFEETFLKERGVPARFVGHPLVDRLKNRRSPEAIRAAHGLPSNVPLVGLLAGSRPQEVERLGPVLVQTAELLLAEKPNLHFVAPKAETISTSQMRACLGEGFPYTLVENPAPDFRSALFFAITKSGTSTLENAILGVPQVIVYKGRTLDAWIARRVIKVQWLGLVNILAGEEICPEFLQQDCVPERIASAVLPLLAEGPARSKMKEAMSRVAASLGGGNSAGRAAEAILECMKK